MTKLKEGYKETEIGVIPVDWELVELQDISDFITKGATPTTYGYDWEDKGIFFFKSDCVKDGRFVYGDYKFISKEAHESMKRSKVRAGDLLLSITGNIGKVCRIPKEIQEANINQHMAKINILSASMNSEFVYQWLCRDEIEKNYYKIKTGLAYPQISLKQVRETIIPVPTLSEQKYIAEILSTTDEHIEKLDKTIEDYQLLKKGMMKKLLSEGIGHTEFKDTEIGRIPKEWEVKELADISEIVTGSTPKTSEKENYGNEFIWVSPADLGNMKYVNETNKMLSKNGFFKTRQLPKGAIVVTCIGSTIGKIGILNDIGSTNQQINSMICKEDVYNEYVYYSLDFHFNKYTSYISTQAVPIINKTVFSKLKLPLPALSEQKHIAAILAESDKRIEIFLKEQKDFIQLKKALMEQLLTGKIRVNTPVLEGNL